MSFKSEKVIVSDSEVRHAFGMHNPSTSLDIRVPGTLHYVSPEVLEQGESEIGSASDVWAIGCIRYEMVTGVPLFDDEEEIRDFAKTGFSATPEAKYKRFNTSPMIAQLVGSCLRRNPSNRLTVFVLLDHLRPEVSFS